MNSTLEAQGDSTLQKDIEEVVDSPKYNFEALKNKTVFITGASGLIGSQIVRTLACYNRKKGMNTKIVALVRNKEKAKEKFGSLINRNNIEICQGDVTKPIEYNGKVDYIIHGASPTESKFFVTNPVETIESAVMGTKNVLDFARKNNVDGMVYLSSLEVYGTNKEKQDITEDDYGYIDILSTRSSYSEGKKIAECMCKSYSEEYNVPAKIARLSQTFGPGVEYNDKRVFAEFCRAAIEKKDIVLHTEGKTVRTYCYTKDAVTGILTVLLNGREGEAYNISNKNTAISIKDMAELVCKTFPESNIKVNVDIPENIEQYGYNPEMIIKLNTDKLEKLGWSATTDLEQMFINTKKSIVDRKKQKEEEYDLDR